MSRDRAGKSTDHIAQKVVEFEPKLITIFFDARYNGLDLKYTVTVT